MELQILLYQKSIDKPETSSAPRGVVGTGGCGGKSTLQLKQGLIVHATVQTEQVLRVLL